MLEKQITLQVSIGSRLISFKVDPIDYSIKEIHSISVVAPIQYVWPHPLRNLLYVACSNRSISSADDIHSLVTIAVNEHTGMMQIIGQIAITSRPIHLTMDSSGQQLFVAYNAPSLMTVHPVLLDGTVGAASAPISNMIFGNFPHQILITPSGNSAILVTRGNDANGDAPEKPGALIVFPIKSNSKSPVQVTAPNGGYGFGPRHLDFHPNGRWVAVSIERQNQLHIYELCNEKLSDEPIYNLSTLPQPMRSSHDQLAGTIHFHPNGRYLYVVNRNDTSVYGDPSDASEYEGNNIVVYGFDEITGEPKLIQHVLTESIHVRTFSIDDDCGLLVAASILPALARVGNKIEMIPAKLSFFQIEANGKLTLVRTHQMSNQRESMFWSRLNTNKKIHQLTIK